MKCLSLTVHLFYGKIKFENRQTDRQDKKNVPEWFDTENIIQLFSWLRGEQSNYCPEVVEKIWETVARGRRPRATVSQIFSTTERQWFDCSPSRLEIPVLLPNYLNYRNTVNSTPMNVVDVGTFDVSWRHLSCNQSIVHYWTVNSFCCCPLT